MLRLPFFPIWQPASIHTQISATQTRAHFDRVLDAFFRLGRALDVID